MDNTTSPIAIVAAAILLLPQFLAGRPPVLAAEEPIGADLDKAVAALRHVEPEKLTAAEKQIQAAAVQRAWKVIEGAKDAGMQRLKDELRRLNEAGEQDNFFKLNAAALIWTIGGLDQAQAIADIWASTPLTAYYNYMFYPAFEAALTHSERALPMLKACLKDESGTVFVAARALTIRWPMTAVFIWGVYGPVGLPPLDAVLGSSRDAAELESSALLLSEAQYLDALPVIRKLAGEGSPAGQTPEAVRLRAVESLGLYGHPQDYDFLIAGLASEKADEARHFVYALHQYEDLRAVPHLVPLLKSTDASLRREVIGALVHLLTPESLEALHGFGDTAKDEDERVQCRQTVGKLMDALNLTYDAYAAKSPEEKADLLAALRQRADTIKGPEGTPLTRDEFLAMLGRWQRQRRLDAGAFKWDERQLLSVATPDDINPLLDARAAVYTRLSDECISEAATVDEAVRLLGRSRYRTEPGLTQKAELVGN